MALDKLKYVRARNTAACMHARWFFEPRKAKEAHFHHVMETTSPKQMFIGKRETQDLTKMSEEDKVRDTIKVLETAKRIKISEMIKRQAVSYFKSGSKYFMSRYITGRGFLIIEKKNGQFLAYFDYNVAQTRGTKDD